MKYLKIIVLTLVVSTLMSGCGEQKRSEESSEEIVLGEAKVEVIYFHGNRRCPNCNAIEDAAKQVVFEDFNNNEDVKFFAINFEKSDNKEFAKKFDIRMSSLIVSSGDEYIDLTLDAFQFAMTDPEYFKSEVIDVINEYL